MPELEIAAVDDLDDALYDDICRLLPQLSTAELPALRHVTDVVGNPANTVLTARLDGQVVGMLTLVHVTLLTGMAAHIEDVVVDEQARGHGVGRALVRRALEIAERGGARHVDLTSRPSREAANRLYASIGFELRATNAYRYAV